MTSEWRITVRILVLAVVIGFFGPPASVAAPPTTTVTLQFEMQALDLDTWTVFGDGEDPEEDLFDAFPDADLMVAYHADRADPATILQNNSSGVEIAFLDSTPFESVEDVTALSFSIALVDQGFGADDTIVLKTGTGACFKLGRPTVDLVNGTVTFDYEWTGQLSAGNLVGADDPGTAVATLVQPAVPALPAEISAEDWQAISSLVRDAQYRVEPFEGGESSYVARNARHRMESVFHPDGVRITPSGDSSAWESSLVLRRWGYEGALRPAGEAELVAEGNRLEYRREALTEWYVNRPDGLEQGFTLATPPGARDGRLLSVQFDFSGALVPRPTEDGSAILLADAAGKTILRYAGLKAWDAEGRDLPASMVSHGNALTLEVDDRAAVYPVTIDPTIVNEDAKLTASDAAASDRLGLSVAVSNDTVVVGAPGQGDPSAAYIFVRSGGSWAEQAKLTSNAEGRDSFGWGVAISGDTAVIMAPHDPRTGAVRGSGAAYVFVRNGTTWTQQAKLTASDAALFDVMGFGVAMSGDTILAPVSRDDDLGTDSGSAYVFVRSGTTWTEQAKLTASDGAAGDLLGAGDSTGVSGDTAVVGARHHDHAAPDSGSAYVFVRSGTTWTEQAELTASDAAADDHFGRSAAVDGDTIVVGAVDDDDAGSRSGSAYVFVRSGTTWTQQAKLTASDAAADDRFGHVSVSGDVIVVSAERDDDGGTDSGSAYVFVRNGTSWSEVYKFTASDAAAADRFGRHVAVDAGTVVVGAFHDDHAGPRSGSAYVLELNQPPACSAAGPPSAVECGGATTTIGLDGSASSDPDGDPLTFSWTTDCPGGSFDDFTSATPILTVDSSSAPCPLNCSATLTVTDTVGEPNTCAATAITVDDTASPALLVDITPITVTDVDCSGDEAAALPTASATDACDAAPVVGSDAPTTFPVGQTTTVTYTASDACSNSSSTGVDVTVLYGADIAIKANKHTVGAGSHPGSTKEPLVGIEVCAYDKADGSCSRDTCGGISHQHYQCIVDTCASVSCCTTGANGGCTINAPPGDYIVISDDATKTVLPDPLGVSASDLLCGELKQKHLQQIVKASGAKVPGKTTRLTGSELLVIEPEFIEWTGVEELYPFVFETVGDWDVTTSVEPPEGFVADYSSLSEQVISEIEAVQFTITDVGSEWVPTGVQHVIDHKGRRETVVGRVSVRLTEDLARRKGLDRSGHVLDPQGRPRPEPGFDPRAERPAEVAGWVEPTADHPGWTFKLRVLTGTDVTLGVARGNGRLVRTLANERLEPGDYEIEWNGLDDDGRSLTHGRYFLQLIAGDVKESVRIVDNE